MSVLYVRLDADEYEALKQAAKADDRTISQAVRVALRQYLAVAVSDSQETPE